jgi:hypothetical protein
MERVHASISITDIKIPIPEIIQHHAPKCDALLNRMFYLTFLPAVKSKYGLVKYGIPILANCVLVAAVFCPLYYPAYYPTQAVVWTTDMALITIVYNYILYLQTQWESASSFEMNDVRKGVHRVSITFYSLYLVYWLYFAVIQFMTHSAPSVLVQLGNTLMSTAWYLFFSTIAVMYYFICVKLSQRGDNIRLWLKTVKDKKPSLEDFYLEYNFHYKRIRIFGNYWNFLIFLGVLLLSIHIPIDLVSILYNKYYYDAFGLVIKLVSLLWYLWRICELNEYETYIVAFMYKHRLYSMEEIEDLEKYFSYRPLGLDFYGIKINKSLIIKAVLVVLNLVVPTLYALLSSSIGS